MVNTDTLEIELLMMGAIVLILAAAIIYLIALLGRVEMMLYRMQKLLHPEVLRDANGERLRFR